jgi:antitoxin MazE
MTTKIQKWGNSLGVRIPKRLADSLLLEEGAAVDFEKVGTKIIITPAIAKPIQKINHKKLLKGMKPGAYHKEIDWGSPVGKEVW